MFFLLAFLLTAIAQQFIPLENEYVASYGPYYTKIPVNDPLMREDFDFSKCGNNCWSHSNYNHRTIAFNRAMEVQNAQMEAFWTQ